MYIVHAYTILQTRVSVGESAGDNKVSTTLCNPNCWSMLCTLTRTCFVALCITLRLRYSMLQCSFNVTMLMHHQSIGYSFTDARFKSLWWKPHKIRNWPLNRGLSHYYHLYDRHTHIQCTCIKTFPPNNPFQQDFFS